MDISLREDSLYSVEIPTFVISTDLNKLLQHLYFKYIESNKHSVQVNVIHTAGDSYIGQAYATYVPNTMSGML